MAAISFIWQSTLQTNLLNPHSRSEFSCRQLTSFLLSINKFSSLRLSLYEQIGHRYPNLVQPKLVHGFYVAHRLDFSTVNTGCLYKLSRINLLFGPLKCSKSNFNPVHVFLHFNSFCLEVLKLILASKLSELEQFENRAANGLFTYKIEFSGKWLRSRAILNQF